MWIANESSSLIIIEAFSITDGLQYFMKIAILKNSTVAMPVPYSVVLNVSQSQL